jgi:uncharacterized protein YkwD
MGQGYRHTLLAAACAPAIGLAALVFPAGAAGGSVCANANEPATSSSPQQMDSAVVCLVNEQRTERGLPPLSTSSKLDRSAQSWTNTMVARGEFDHADFANRINAVHYDWQTAGENIATGYNTPAATVRAWMASPDHCRNILDPSFRNVGSGVKPAPVRGWATGPSTWTQDFGLTMSQSPPSHDGGPQAGCPYR